MPVAGATKTRINAIFFSSNRLYVALQHLLLAMAKICAYYGAVQQINL